MVFSSALRLSTLALLSVLLTSSVSWAKTPKCITGTDNNLAKKWGIYDPLRDEDRDHPNLTIEEILELRQVYHLGYYFFENSKYQRFNESDLRRLKQSGLILFDLANSRSQPFLSPDFFNTPKKIRHWTEDEFKSIYLDGLGYNSEAGGSPCINGKTDNCNSATDEQNRAQNADEAIKAMVNAAHSASRFYIILPPPLAKHGKETKYGIDADWFAYHANVLSPWVFSRGEWTPQHAKNLNLIQPRLEDLLARWRKWAPQPYPIYPTIDWGRGNFGQVNGTLTFETEGQVKALAKAKVPSVILFDPAEGYRCMKNIGFCTGMQKLITLAEGQTAPAGAVATPRTKEDKQVYQLPNPSIKTARTDIKDTLKALKAAYGHANPACVMK